MRSFRFAYLLMALIAVSFLRPFLGERLLGLAIIDLLLFLTLILGAFAVIDRRAVFLPVVVIGLICAAAQIAGFSSESTAAVLTYLSFALLFYGVITFAMVRSLFEHHEAVTRDTLCQAISAYLLMGILGAVAYSLLEVAAPGSFSFGPDPVEPGARFDRFLGFSFTTLTTLGYGNIAPTTARADGLTTLQATAGPIYLAIVIARLVAIQTSHRTPAQDGSST